MGSCNRCDVKLEGRKKLCEPCGVQVKKENAASKRMTLLAQRRNLGLCLTCAIPTDEKAYCPKCTTNKHLYKEQRKVNGLCYDCGGDREDQDNLCCNKCRDKKKTKIARWRRVLKLEAFSHYGGFCCACCGESNEAFLQIDHIEGGGGEHRKLTGGGGTQLYNHLRKENWPTGYQVLCANCNWGKRFSGVCPHKLPHCISATVATITEIDYAYE